MTERLAAVPAPDGDHLYWCLPVTQHMVAVADISVSQL